VLFLVGLNTGLLACLLRAWLGPFGMAGTVALVGLGLTVGMFAGRYVLPAVTGRRY
jgi:hypothetical protein